MRDENTHAEVMAGFAAKRQEDQIVRRARITPFLDEVEVRIAAVRVRMAENPIPSDLYPTEPEKMYKQSRTLLAKSELDIHQDGKLSSMVKDLEKFIGVKREVKKVNAPATLAQQAYIRRLGEQPESDHMTMSQADAQIKELLKEHYGDIVDQTVHKARRFADNKEAGKVKKADMAVAQTLSTCIELEDFPTYYFDARSFRVLNKYGKAMSINVGKAGEPRWMLKDVNGKRRWLSMAQAFASVAGIEDQTGYV